MKSIFKSASDMVKNVTGSVNKFNTKEQVSNRHETDMLADNKLSKNARPIALFWVLALLTLGIVLSCYKVVIPETFQETIFWAVSIALPFYFGGRSLEKFKKANVKVERKKQKNRKKSKKK